MFRFPVSGARAFALATIATALAACGGGSDPAPSPTAVLGVSQTAAAPAPAPTTTASTTTASTTTQTSTASVPATPKSVVETASALPQFSSLVAALRFASEGDDLVRLLSSPGTFTVFAPTNAAFDALARELTRNSSATAADLLVPANKALVRAVLQYHVLGAVVRRADVPLGAPIDPVLAGTDAFRIDAAGDALVITDARFRTARITTTDVAATNGVIHVIDRVILPAAPAADRTIVEIAAGNENFTSLVAALGFASDNDDLVRLLSGTGTFTVFAPTNAAFDALARELTGDSNATAAALLVPANRALVRDVLRYHVLATEVFAAQLRSGRSIEPALGGGTFFKVETGGARPEIVDGRGRKATIVATDVDATNGVVHVIDRVILPADRSIVQLAAAAPAFSSLVAALQFASNDGDLVRALSGPGRFTVFAPTNDAFDALARELTHDPRATAAALLVPANRALVRAVLEYHVLGSRVLRAEIPLGAPIDPLLAGTATFAITRSGDALTITDARGRRAGIVATDVFATNGVVHAIDRVILPPAH
ncbi:MAG: fasciclin domain-containing protein [Burkholderiales bacterium]|jgi:transforming growth factor-beta-induced protein